jgi:hypothetical protein
MQRLYDRTRVSDPRIEPMSWSAALINSVGENTFRGTQVDNSETRNTHFLGNCTTPP